MKKHLFLLFLFSIQNCTHQPKPSDPFATQKTSFKPTNELLGDTVKLHISNGSLSPEYQYSKEWMFTEKEAVYRETIGENPESVSRKKMDPQFWEQLRTFDANAPFDKAENQLEGAEEAWLIFHSGEKKYRFSADVMQNKTADISAFFDTIK